MLFFVTVPPLRDVANEELLRQCTASLRAHGYRYVLLDNGANGAARIRALAGEHAIVVAGMCKYSAGALADALRYWTDSSSEVRRRMDGALDPTATHVAIMQHSMRLEHALLEPRCDVETLHVALHSRAGQARGYGPTHEVAMAFVSDVLSAAFNATCSPPCPRPNGTVLHARNVVHWPVFPHNSILFSPVAVAFLAPLVAYMQEFRLPTLAKGVEEGSERLWGILSALMGGRTPLDRQCERDAETYGLPMLCDCPTCCAQRVATKAHGGAPPVEGVARVVGAAA